MNELIQNIKAWGIAKGITGPNGKGTLLGQLAKTQEELTETRDAAVWVDAMRRAIGQVTDSEINAIKDGIGDTAVTLILAAEMAGLDFEACLQAAYDEIKSRTGIMQGGIFVKDKP
jgi:NTP pyrophosphatase (non-canonical NTP hydrolase)